MHNRSNDTPRHLGTVLSEHHVTRLYLWIIGYGSLGSLAMAVWMVVETARAIDRQVPDKVGLGVGLVVMFAAFAFWYGRECLRSLKAHVRVCEHGLHLQLRDGSQSWRWNEIRRTRVETAKGSVETLTLETAVGEQRLPKGLSDGYVLVNAFVRRGLINEAELPRGWRLHLPD